ncbi:MAG TPA: response regulator [Candidatus Andersenbacteria bacterium]|nr:response regulator [Candidatus Andersenbacteria bacterium]
MKKILIVDDDPIFQKTMTAKLELLAYSIVSAFDGEEGLTKAQQEKPDLILLDIKMPKLDGLSMLKKLQSNKDGQTQIPVLITSNLSSTENISEGVSLGIRGYIIKSNETLDTIVKEVETILNSNIR